MTRETEEAIRHIRSIIPYVGRNIKKSLEMAIQALEQEPCEDCIPREYVIALLENKKRTRKEITNRIYEYVRGVSE